MYMNATEGDLCQLACCVFGLGGYGLFQKGWWREGEGQGGKGWWREGGGARGHLIAGRDVEVI